MNSLETLAWIVGTIEVIFVIIVTYLIFKEYEKTR